MRRPTSASKVTAVLLAPLCRDEIVTANSRLIRAGGAGLYAAWALAGLGARVVLHTPLGPDDEDLLASLPPGVETVTHPSRCTTRFRIEVDPADPDRRRMRVRNASDPLSAIRIGNLRGVSFVVAGPLLPTDWNGSLTAHLDREGAVVHLGLQGFVRRVTGSGALLHRRPVTPVPLPALATLAGDERELRLFTGARSLAHGFRELAGSSGPGAAARPVSPREIIATAGAAGATIAVVGGDVVHIPARRARKVRHPVGLGDTFLAVYAFHRHLGLAPARAGARAAAAAARLLESGLPDALPC
jgi:sugar/nucleoside kinase (ribokinase family)